MKKLISKYISLTGDEEDKRLALQNKALYFFDYEIYKRTFEKYADPAILDIGCGTGNMIGSVLREIPSYRLFGVDEVKRQINLARESFPSGHFYELDVEAEDFFTSVSKIMDENAIEGFDVINCSMVILHLKDPTGILSGLRQLLSEKGTLIIRDIDDGIHFAWPDPENRFRRFCDIIAADDRLGDRRCGRKIFRYLKKAGYNDIHLEKEGLSTADMDDGMLLYDMFFPDILHYMEQRHMDFPENEQWKKDYYWFRDNNERMKRSFAGDDFIFSIGFMNYTARR